MTDSAFTRLIQNEPMRRRTAALLKASLSAYLYVRLSPFPRRGSSSKPSMDVGALGRPPG